MMKNKIVSRVEEPHNDLENFMLKDSILILKHQLSKGRTEKQQIEQRLHQVERSRDMLISLCLTLDFDCSARSIAEQICNQHHPAQNVQLKRSMHSGRQSLTIIQSNDPQYGLDKFQSCQSALKLTKAVSSTVLVAHSQTKQELSNYKKLKTLRTQKAPAENLLPFYEIPRTLAKAKSQKRLSYFEKCKETHNK